MLTIILLLSLCILIKPVMGYGDCGIKNVTGYVGSDVDIPLSQKIYRGNYSIYEVNQGVTTLVSSFDFHYSYPKCKLEVIVKGNFDMFCTRFRVLIRMKTVTKEDSGLYLITNSLNDRKPWWFDLFYITVGREAREDQIDITSIYIKRGESFDFSLQNIWGRHMAYLSEEYRFYKMKSGQAIPKENECYLSWNKTSLKMIDFILFDPVNVTINDSEHRVTCLPDDVNTKCTFKLEIRDNVTRQEVIGQYDDKLSLPILEDVLSCSSVFVCTSCTDMDGKEIDGSMVMETPYKCHAKLIFPPANQIHYVTEDCNVTVTILIFSNLKIEEVTLFGVAHDETYDMDMTNIVWNEQYLKMTPKSSVESKVSELNFQIEVNQSIEYYFLVARNQLVENSFKFTVKVIDKKLVDPEKDLPGNIFHVSLFGNLIFGLFLLFTISYCIIRCFLRRTQKQNITSNRSDNPYNDYDEIGTLYGGSTFRQINNHQNENVHGRAIPEMRGELNQNFQAIENDSQRQSSEPRQGQTSQQPVQHLEVTRQDVDEVVVIETRDGYLIPNQQILQSVHRPMCSSQTNPKTFACQKNKASKAPENDFVAPEDTCSQTNIPVYCAPSETSQRNNQNEMHCDNEDLRFVEKGGYLVPTSSYTRKDLNQSATHVYKPQNILISGSGQHIFQESNDRHGYLVPSPPLPSRNQNQKQNVLHNSQTSMTDKLVTPLDVPIYEAQMKTKISDSHEQLKITGSSSEYIRMNEYVKRDRQSTKSLYTDIIKTDSCSNDMFSDNIASDQNEYKGKGIDNEHSLYKDNVSKEDGENEGTKNDRKCSITIRIVTEEDEIEKKEIDRKPLFTGNDMVMEDENEGSCSRHSSTCGDALPEIKNEVTNSLNENSDNVYLSLLSENNGDRPYDTCNSSDQEKSIDGSESPEYVNRKI